MSDNHQEHDTTPLCYTKDSISSISKKGYVCGIAIGIVLCVTMVVCAILSEEFRRYVLYPVIVFLCISTLIFLGKKIAPWVKSHLF